jgi:SAM-dependent methyltransferase
MQQRVTRTFLLTVTDGRLATHGFHLGNYGALPSRGRALEFGCGSNLLLPLLLRREGALEVHAYDLERLATVEQVNHVIGQLRARFPGDWPDITDLDRDLFEKYRIAYRAPADASTTDLPNNSVDFVCSTSVLEHVPAEQLRPLLRESARIVSSRGVMSHVIGYVDHYAHSDTRISYFNFYRYSKSRWQLFNPSMHYQNRLRHSDFEKLFASVGLTAVRAERVMSPLSEREPEVPIAPEFRHYSEEDLYAHDGLFVLGKGAASTRAQ